MKCHVLSQKTGFGCLPKFASSLPNAQFLRPRNTSLPGEN